MRHHLFPLACLAVAALAALLLWLWASDYPLRRACAKHAGSWDAETRTCVLTQGPVREAIVSPPG